LPGTNNSAGFIIRIFALVVGMFSVANIMFVSVKESTNNIGIKMALGAKRCMSNILVRLLTLILEGIISGFIPAIQTSGMDTVEVIRK
jgi:putative ABC transport system permease protein